VISWDFDMIVGDSGLAIALNMVGIFAIFVYLFYLRFLSQIYKALREKFDYRLAVIMGFLSLAIANSVMQELAIGPYGVGMALLLLGIHRGRETQLANTRI
jgi:hypothetical protein